MITYLAPPPAHTGPFTDATGPLLGRSDPWHTHGPVTTAHLVALHDRDFDLAVSNVWGVLFAGCVDEHRGCMSLVEIRDQVLHGMDTVIDALRYLETIDGTHHAIRVSGRYSVRSRGGWVEART